MRYIDVQKPLINQWLASQSRVESSYAGGAITTEDQNLTEQKEQIQATKSRHAQKIRKSSNISNQISVITSPEERQSLNLIIGLDTKSER